MIQLIEAPPRSGKTFFFVNYLMKFCKFDKLYNEYILQPHVLIISNVRGLRIRHWSFPDCLKGRSFEEFFTEENFHKIMEKTGKTHIILGLDECHTLFPASMTIKTHPSIYEFFAIHGHFGLDVFLMTQGIEATTRIFNPLLECVVKVKPRSQKLYKVFSYDFYTKAGLFLRSEKLICNQLTFDAYKSFEVDEKNKPRSALVYLVGYVVVMLLLAFGLFSWAISDLGGSRPAPAKKELVRYVPPPEKARETQVVEKSEPIEVASQTSEDFSKKWRIYYLEGYFKKADKIIYIINGQVMHDSENFRRYSPVSKTVEYFGALIR